MLGTARLNARAVIRAATNPEGRKTRTVAIDRGQEERTGGGGGGWGVQ